MQKSILITGCSSGIGYAAAHDLRARGWRVFASCRKQADCNQMIVEGFESPRLDLADEESVAEGLAEVLAATGGTLDALFNNGAYAMPGAVEDLPRQALREIFETNLFGTQDLTNRVIPIMRAQGHGRIINNSSILGLVAYKWRGAYVATKFALEGLTDTLRHEMRGTGIHIILVEPGPVTSKIRQNSIPHFERFIDWKKSVRASQYEKLLNRLYKSGAPDRFELPPSAVSKKLIHALEHPRPHARYFVTQPTFVMNLLRRVLSTRMLDAILSRG
ncbi:MAG: SDR family NAD(P)-dependent oxidoreductase [Paracoccaceae bacterium]|nr:SDR family NAD(P)-dependent oxidoreductase [Paracoccaceae bacterium]MDG2258684.1 SDR family NAD(P)-dependent oxidoreductase [Paracoccaceae bacterium]